METINIRKISRYSYKLFMLYKLLDNQGTFIQVRNRPFARWPYFTILVLSPPESISFFLSYLNFVITARLK